MLEETARTTGSVLHWSVKGYGSSDLRLSSRGDVHSVYLANQRGDFAFFEQLGKLSSLPWIELRIQEGALWDYTLFKGDQCADMFSVCPQYFSDPRKISVVSFAGSLKKIASIALGSKQYKDFDERLAAWEGKPAVLAELWDLPVERIERYLVNWGFATNPGQQTFKYERSGRAYTDDQFEYGNYEQFYDVLRVLGAMEPTDFHTLELPKSEQKSPK